MTNELPNLLPAVPEIFFLGMICITLLADLFIEQKRRLLTFFLAEFTLLGAMLLTVLLFGQQTVITFNNSFILDHVSVVLKLFIYTTTFFVLLYSRDYVEQREFPQGEYYILTLFSVLGMMVLVSAYSFITLYLGLELLSLPLYTLVALKRNSKVCPEAAMKYFVMGAVASGMLLYGLSMIYGATQALDIPTVAQAIASIPASQDLILVFGLVFVVVGLAFKFGAVPFHMWIPDVYEGAPSSVTLFIATAPKLAAFGMAVRLLVNAMPELVVQWQQLLIIISILSMALGNFAAIAQTNLKRMLAYSSIAHVGYMLLGLIAGNELGYGASTFYIVVYSVMSLGAFGMITVLSRAGFEAENISDFKGLNSRNSWLAFLMLLIMFSMAGVPPMIGFFAKVAVLEALVKADLTWLAVVALMFAIVGVYYYLRIVKVIYFDEPEEATPIVLGSYDRSIAISLNGLFILGLGLFPSALYEFCKMAFQ